MPPMFHSVQSDSTTDPKVSRLPTHKPGPLLEMGDPFRPNFWGPVPSCGRQWCPNPQGLDPALLGQDFNAYGPCTAFASVVIEVAVV